MNDDIIIVTAAGVGTWIRERFTPSGIARWLAESTTEEYRYKMERLREIDDRIYDWSKDLGMYIDLMENAFTGKRLKDLASIGASIKATLQGITSQIETVKALTKPLEKEFYEESGLSEVPFGTQLKNLFRDPTGGYQLSEEQIAEIMKSRASSEHEILKEAGVFDFLDDWSRSWVSKKLETKKEKERNNDLKKFFQSSKMIIKQLQRTSSRLNQLRASGDIGGYFNSLKEIEKSQNDFLYGVGKKAPSATPKGDEKSASKEGFYYIYDTYLKEFVEGDSGLGASENERERSEANRASQTATSEIEEVADTIKDPEAGPNTVIEESDEAAEAVNKVTREQIEAQITSLEDRLRSSFDNQIKAILNALNTAHAIQTSPVANSNTIDNANLLEDSAKRALEQIKNESNNEAPNTQRVVKIVEDTINNANALAQTASTDSNLAKNIVEQINSVSGSLADGQAEIIKSDSALAKAQAQVITPAPAQGRRGSRRRRGSEPSLDEQIQQIEQEVSSLKQDIENYNTEIENLKNKIINIATKGRSREPLTQEDIEGSNYDLQTEGQPSLEKNKSIANFFNEKLKELQKKQNKTKSALESKVKDLETRKQKLKSSSVQQARPLTPPRQSPPGTPAGTANESKLETPKPEETSKPEETPKPEEGSALVAEAPDLTNLDRTALEALRQQELAKKNTDLDLVDKIDEEIERRFPDTSEGEGPSTLPSSKASKKDFNFLMKLASAPNKYKAAEYLLKYSEQLEDINLNKSLKLLALAEGLLNE